MQFRSLWLSTDLQFSLRERRRIYAFFTCPALNKGKISASGDRSSPPQRDQPLPLVTLVHGDLQGRSSELTSMLFGLALLILGVLLPLLDDMLASYLKQGCDECEGERYEG